MRIFEHDFVADKAKIRRRAAARQGFLTQYAAKFAKRRVHMLMKTGSYSVKIHVLHMGRIYFQYLLQS